MKTRTLSIKAIATALAVCALVALAASSVVRAQAPGQAVDKNGAPMFKVDPFWPKPLPNRWSMQQVTGIHVDHMDHVWFLNRLQDVDPKEMAGEGTPAPALCCVRGPEVIELDQQGNVLNAWGGAGFHPKWPTALQTVIADTKGFVWISGTDAQDSIMKFTRDGKLVWDFEHRPAPEAAKMPENNQETGTLINKGRFQLDEVANELYIIQQKRVLIYDASTGAFKRGWGAYGKALSEISNDGQPQVGREGAEPAKDFKSPVHCVRISKDGLVYVCDRGGNRVQVFTKDGKFQKEFFVARNTGMRGTVGSVDFSPDAAQKYIFIADIMNMTVWQLDRQTGAVVQRIGKMGREGGNFAFLHLATMDSKGNLYTGEVATGRRIQKFSPQN